MKIGRNDPYSYGSGKKHKQCCFAAQENPPSAPDESKRLADLPDVKTKLAEILAQHYDSWLDESIPALGGRTPLEAVQDPDGCEMVEALVGPIKRDSPNVSPPLDPAIGRQLRERLGLPIWIACSDAPVNVT
jgi:hypothetical protein